MKAKPNTNGQFLAPSEKATSIADLPTIFLGCGMVAEHVTNSACDELRTDWR